MLYCRLCQGLLRSCASFVESHKVRPQGFPTSLCINHAFTRGMTRMFEGVALIQSPALRSCRGSAAASWILPNTKARDYSSARCAASGL